MASLDRIAGLAQDACSIWLGVLADATLKGLVVLTMAVVVARAMSSASSAARHLVWLLAIISLGLLPALSAGLPGWERVPSWAYPSLPRMDRHAERAPKLPAAPEPLARESIAESLPVRPEVAAHVPGAAATGASVPVENSASPRSRMAAGYRWQIWAALAWLVGAAVGMTPWIMGVLSLRRVTRSADEVSDGPIATAMGRTAREMGIRRRVALLVSRERKVPMQWGYFRPRLMVPVDAIEWPADRLRAVLLHELAHVRRGDYLAQFVAHVVSAVYWFNPWAWLARRRMQAEAESACDDLVLRAGCTSVAYARHLVEIASGASAGGPAGYAAIAISRSARLEGRVRAILDPRRNRGPLVRRTFGAALVGLLLLLVPLAMLRATTETGPTATVSADAAEVADEVGSREPDPAQPGKRADASPQSQQPTAPQEQKRRRVGQAVARGIDFLRRRQKPDGGWPESSSQPGGVTALSALALVRSGVGANVAPLRKAIEYLRLHEGVGGKGDHHRTYSLSLETMLLCALDRHGHAEAIRHNVEWLERAQGADGWSYDERGGPGDHSNTHFALMALDAADKAGVPVQSKTWRTSLEHWIKVQNSDGSWGYKVGAPGTGSMTCAGFSSVAMAATRIHKEEGMVRQAESAIAKADRWMSRNFAVKENPGSPMGIWGFYYLHALSRAGQDARRARIGGHDWYGEMCVFLAAAQREPDGAWSGRGAIEGDALIATSFALLCLAAEPQAEANPGPRGP